jgi:hypothetical protein
MPEKHYLIHNTTRDVITRLARKQSPEPPRMTLILGGGSVRVVRKRPQAVTESLVKRLLPELKRQEQAGRCRVTTVEGLPVDLNTFKVVGKAPVSPPQPKPPVDSVAADKNEKQGIPMVTHKTDVGALPRSAEPPVPAVGERAIPEGEPAPEPEPPVEDVSDEPPPDLEPEFLVEEAIVAPTTGQEDPAPSSPSSSSSSGSSRKKGRGRR